MNIHKYTTKSTLLVQMAMMTEFRCNAYHMFAPVDTYARVALFNRGVLTIVSEFPSWA